MVFPSAYVEVVVSRAAEQPIATQRLLSGVVAAGPIHSGSRPGDALWGRGFDRLFFEVPGAKDCTNDPFPCRHEAVLRRVPPTSRSFPFQSDIFVSVASLGPVGSIGYLLDVDMAPSSQHQEPPLIPGRFTVRSDGGWRHWNTHVLKEGS